MRLIKKSVLFDTYMRYSYIYDLCYACIHTAISKGVRKKNKLALMFMNNHIRGYDYSFILRLKRMCRLCNHLNNKNHLRKQNLSLIYDVPYIYKPMQKKKFSLC